MKRRVEIPCTPGATTEARLPKGMLHTKLSLSLLYTLTLTTAGNAVRPRGVPIKRIQIIGDQGVVLQSLRPRDAIMEAEVMEQTALAALVTPAGGFGIGTYAGCAAHVPVFFAEPFASADGFLTSLPSWLYNEIIVRVDWGDVTDCVTGTPVGTITAPSAWIVLESADELGTVGNAAQFGAAFGVAYKSFSERASVAANGALPIDVPRNEDIRSIFVVTEDATGEPSNAILNGLTLEENARTRRYANVHAASLRADNAAVFGVTPPPGLYILEFAADKDIRNILPCGSANYDALQLQLDVNGVTANIRTFYRRLGQKKV